ncbi:substrate-binding domain-containing protein [Hespellia stercorisuis]|uniref:Monosaccharide ABC transporter substrate-binding protein, CUT2 family (TC 3.A.1.2.-) n=1 Tax=Hespellia stercorisuis DSM 15480 TaxID=1121950 RepID=A0A1M6RB81_9FIRM|nr:substrate-binding domain-containing protein [Hespellia stercorisuis]SHK29587.1 monosaccharide ABC transporter substrate-binding protein, CUT2 family (TC 3.A.1.2.-) [Hespellia stercorisuis DSM 15480]
MKKRMIAMFLAGSMVFSLSACSEKIDNTATLKAGEVPTYQGNLNAINPLAYNNVDGLDLEKGTFISIIGRQEATPYWTTVEAGVKQATEDLNTALGYTGDDKIKVTFNAPSKEEDIDEQVNILDEELSRYPNAIGIASIDDSACSMQFDLATESDIPIVAFDSGNNYQGILCTCRTNNEEAAGTAAAKLCGEIEDSGEVILIAHDENSSSGKERVKGFTDEITNNHPNVKIVETIYNSQMDAMKKTIAEKKNEGIIDETKKVTVDDLSDEDVIAYYLEIHPEVKGVFATNDLTTQLTLDSCKQMKNTGIKVVGFDYGEDQQKALEDGTLSGLIVQNPFGMGYAAVVACARTILNQGNEAVVDTGYIWVTKDNMTDDSIVNMLYK